MKHSDRVILVVAAFALTGGLVSFFVILASGHDLRFASAVALTAMVIAGALGLFPSME